MQTRQWMIALMLAVATGAPAAHAQGVLNIALQDDPDSLDPALNWSFVGRHVLQSLCDKLVDIDASGKIVPMLARSWSWSPDSRSLTLQLQSNATFQDGTKVDSDAVRYDLDRDLHMKASRRASEISAIAGFQLLGPETLRIDLKQPDVTLLAALTDRAGMMASPKAEQGVDFAAHPVCSGPYRFVQHLPQDKLVLERWPGHWRASDYHFDQLVFRPMPDSNVRFLNLQSGEIDLMERLSPTDVKRVAADHKLQTVESTELGYYGVTFNVANGSGVNPALQNPLVRQAIGLALDRDAINQVAFNGLYEAGNQPFPPESPWYHKQIPVPARDVAAARAKLKQAGIDHLTFEMLVPTDPERQQVAQIMQSMLADAGITLNIRSEELISLLNQARQGLFQSYLVGWSGRVDPDLNITPLLGCDAAGNDGHYCNRGLDDVLAAARQTSDLATRQADYAKAVAILEQDSPMTYLYHSKWVFALKAGITGFRAYPDGIIRLAGVTRQGG
jgi:peptide/nickel transport system substrate-binding protein